MKQTSIIIQQKPVPVAKKTKPPTKQCAGTTLQGVQCQRRIKNGEYCYYHDVKNLPDLMNRLTVRAKVDVITRAAPGYIYAYTLDTAVHDNIHVFDDRVDHFVPIARYDHAAATQPRKPGQNNRNNNNNALAKLMKLLKPRSQGSMMLIKVGFTRSTPAKRLEEWRKKCKHPIKLIGPPKSHAKTAYCRDSHGWYTHDPRTVERAVHAELRGKLGFGHVECGGCSARHHEWFLVERTKVGVIFDTIAYWISVYT